MKIYFTICFVLISVISLSQTTVSTNITTNTVWNIAGSPYTISSNIQVNSGITLTIQSGVKVLFNAGKSITVYGEINSENVTFTSYRDVVGNSPQPNDWTSIYIGYNTTSGTGNFNNCTFNYANTALSLINGNLTVKGCTITNSAESNLYAKDGNLTVYNSSLYYSLYQSYARNITFGSGNLTSKITKSSIYNGSKNITTENSGSLTIDSCNIYNNVANPTTVANNIILSNGNVVISNSNIYQANVLIEVNNSVVSFNMNKLYNLTKDGYGINVNTYLANISVNNGNEFSSLLYPITYEAAGKLFFNSTSSFTNNKYNVILMNFSGYNNNIPYDITLDTAVIPYYFNQSFSIPSNSKITASAGIICKFANYVNFEINGTFKAIGSDAKRIYFTSFSDDNLGGDSNADGSGSAPTIGTWYGVSFMSTSDDSQCKMFNTDVRFGGYYNRGGINIYDSSPTIDNNTLSNNYYGIQIQGESDPIISNNTIGVSQIVPIAMSIHSNPQFINNSFSTQDNKYDGIGLINETITRNAVLKIRSFTSITNVTYIMLGDITVPAGKTLIINKGIVIKSVAGRLIIQGKLIANGAVDSMITFTSIHDDNYGNPFDSNKNGTLTTPEKGNWGGFVFTSTADTASIMNYCRVKYGQNNDYYIDYSNFYGYYYIGGAITIINTSPAISNSLISDCTFSIVLAQSSKSRLTNNTLSNTTYTPLLLSVTALPVIIGNTYQNVGHFGIGIIGEDVGTNSNIIRRTISGIENITYILYNTLEILSGTTVKIDPGTVIKSQNGTIQNYGTFIAKGNSSFGKIIFTSLADDNNGKPKDTNGDGNASLPQKGNWEGIIFQSTSNDVNSIIDSCEIYFANNGVRYINAGSKISNTIISSSYYYGLVYDGNSDGTADNVKILSCRLDPIGLSLKSDPKLYNIIFNANGSNGLKIIDNTLSSNATLKQRDVAGIQNIAYITDGFTVDQNSILTINKGVVIKFTQYAKLSVNGGLIAIGTKTDKVYFTSLNDDSKGGDSNNDGNTSQPSKGNWWGLYFDDKSIDTVNYLKNCEIRYAGGNRYWYYATEYYGALQFVNCKAIVDSCSIMHSYTGGIQVRGSANPIIKNCRFSNISITPLAISMFSNPTIDENNICDNVEIMAIGILPETYSQSASITKRNFAGFTNITYFLLTDYYQNNVITITNGTTITVPEGIIFKNFSFNIDGAIKVNGSIDKPVILTALEDDDFGNPKDSQDNGLTTFQLNRTAFVFNNTSNDTISSIANCKIRYCTEGIVFNSASPLIKNTKFEKCNWGLKLQGISNPKIENCAFNNLNEAPIYTSILSYPGTDISNTIAGSTKKCVGIIPETLVQDYILEKRNFAGIINVPYYFTGKFTIGTGVNLIIKPGIVLKFAAGGSLDVFNSLKAVGGATPDSNIVFTSIFDDFYAGDTNSDSTFTKPNSNEYYDRKNWDGITFENESIDNECELKNVIIKHVYYYANAITLNSASPKISFSTIANNAIGVKITGSSNPKINFCDFVGNSDFAVKNENSPFNIDATSNWWGDNSGPTHSTNPLGQGQKISDKINYNPFLTSGTNNPTVGDVSLNGKIQPYDASLILKYVVDPVNNPLNPIQKKVADVSNNSSIQAYDASLVLQYCVGFVAGFPAEFIQKKNTDNNLLENIKNIIAKQTVKSGSLIIESGKAKRGEIINIAGTLENTSGMTSGEITIKYDPKILEFNGIIYSQISDNFLNDYYSDLSKGTIKIVLANNKEFNTTSKLFNIQFKAIKNISGNVKTTVQVTKFLANETDLTANVVNSNIEVAGKPITFALSQNYPNPFNPITTINYQIPEDNTIVNINIYNALGQLVRTVINESLEAGYYKTTWDGKDNFGSQVSSGIYIYSMKAGKQFSQCKKMILVK